MRRVAAAFLDKKCFIPFITAGYPNIHRCIEAIEVWDKQGAGLVEIGIPFSDPLADGKTIQAASAHVLSAGMKLSMIFDMVKTVRKTCTVPIVFMCYYNLIFHHGLEAFVSACVASGVDGLIVPDLPPEEAGPLCVAAEGKLAMTFLVSTLTAPARIPIIIERTTGFVYLVSRLGVTGKGMGELTNAQNAAEAIRRVTSLPIAVGFGVSSKEDALHIYSFADGVIVGSALVDFIWKKHAAVTFLEDLAQYSNAFLRS